MIFSVQEIVTCFINNAIMESSSRLFCPIAKYAWTRHKLAFSGYHNLQARRSMMNMNRSIEELFYSGRAIPPCSFEDGILTYLVVYGLESLLNKCSHHILQKWRFSGHCGVSYRPSWKGNTSCG